MSGSIQNKRVKAKILVLSLFVSFFSVVSFQNAHASDGAGVWAVVDSSGTVTNVIVCDASTCGSGTFGGQRVVPQIAPNPITNDAQGQGSFIGNESAGIRVTESNGVFTVHEDMRIDRSETEVTVDVLNKTKTTTVSEVSVPVASRSFTYEDTKGKTYADIKPSIKYDDYKETVISVTKETILEKNKKSTLSEKLSLIGRKNASEIEIEIIKNEFTLLMSKIQTLLKMLGGWVKP